jgi:methionyl-tRNA formyltransferase
LTASVPLRLGFAGTPEFSVPALERLASLSSVCAVFTQPDRPAGRGQALKASPVKRRALELGLPLLQPASFKSAEALESLRGLALDILIVVAFGQILPSPVLQTPRLGCINIHASLLPRWRGAAPIQRALLSGDAHTGITIMRMNAGLDTGPMLAQRFTAILATDTGQSLHDRLAEMGADLMASTLPGIAAGSLREQAQPTEGVTYARKIDKSEARIDWRGDVLQVWRQVRAFNPWPIAETRLNGEQLRIFAAEPAGPEPPQPSAVAPGTVLEDTDGIEVACGLGRLRVTRLQLAGRKPLAAADFLKGQRLAGVRLGDL